MQQKKYNKDGISKYLLRILGIGFITRLYNLLSSDWKKLGDEYGREVLIAEVKAKKNNIKVSRSDKPLDVVFFTMIGGNHRLCSMEVVLGRFLIASGHKVRYVLCDKALPICEVKSLQNDGKWEYVCHKCYTFGKAFLEGAGYEVFLLSKLIENNDKNSSDWSEYVDAALLKHYKVGVLQDNQEVKEKRNLFVTTAQITASAAEVIARTKPDRVVMSHGIYCTWGPAREIINNASIPLLTYGEGKVKDTVKFNWSCSADWWDVSEEWAKIKDVPLTIEQEQVIDGYLESRRTHEQDARVYNFGDEETLEETRKRLGLDPDKQTFVLFTNVLWDAASAQREIAFKNPIDWVLETIEWFVEHSKKQLVIKIHPAEVVIGTNQPFTSIISERFSKLPDNIRIIKPDEKVNSWSIMRIADLGLVHTSTVGMELPLEGIPCAVVSRTHFRDRGFTVDVNSKEEYFSLIDNWGSASIDKKTLKSYAKRYSYILFKRYQLHFPFLYEKSVNDVRALVNIDGVDFLEHPTMKIFKRAFEDQSDFLVP